MLLLLRHGPSGLIYHISEKANAIAACLENYFHTMTYVMKTMNGGWRPEFKICSKSQTTAL
jgi:hypothetical protein